MLAIVAALAVLATRIKIAFPIVMVFGGLGIALMPGLPPVSLNPDIVLVVFLPPIIFSSALLFPWDEFRSNMRMIVGLAVGLVLATMVCVAFAVHWMIPSIPLAAAFVLGAIVSPPDAVAATSVLHHLRVPRRLVTVLEGESLVNDSSGLVAYTFAVAAVVTGQFSLAQAGTEFVWMSAGGIVLGLGIGWLITVLHSKIDDPAVGITLQILSPYAAFIPAEHIGVSGILAVVATGLFVGNRTSIVLNASTRLQSENVWDFITFVLNGVVFVLIGLEFPVIMQGLQEGHPLWQLFLYGAGVSAVVIAVRFAWIIGLSKMVERTVPALSILGPDTPTGGLVVASWAGMRGVVSLAAALAIPLSIDTGEPFPNRDMILFLTYCVIFTTLVLQGITLPWVVRRAGMEMTESQSGAEASSRLKSVHTVLELIDAEAENPDSRLSPPILSLLQEHFRSREDQLRQSIEVDVPSDHDRDYARFFLQKITAAAIQTLEDLRREGKIDEPLRRRLVQDLDHDEARLRRILRCSR